MIGNPIDRIRGRHCTVLKRASSKGQTTSNANQGRTLDQLVAEASLVVVEEHDLYGVTGSVPGARDDIDLLLGRKARDDDFDLLVVPDATRFTRAGQTHGMKLIHDLRVAGIDLLCNAENLLVADEMSAMYFGWLLMAAHETARSISRGANIGRYQKLIAGQSTHANITAYGLDRLFTSPGGESQYRLRNFPDGRQHMLSADTQEFIREFLPNTEKAINHHSKQKADTVTYLPGDPQQVATLLFMFDLLYRRGWTRRGIARYLNDAGIPSPRGGLWWQSTVGKMLLNPVYVGRGIRYMKTLAVYSMGAEGEPKPSEATYSEINLYDSPLVRLRHPDDWVETQYGALGDLLPADVKELAQRAINANLEQKSLQAVQEVQEREAQKSRKGPKPAESAMKKRRKPIKGVAGSNDRHVESPYLLKQLLKCRQNGWPMSGRKQGKNGRHIRYYGLAKAISAPRTQDAILRRLVPAADAEQRVLEQLKAALLDREMIREAVAEALARMEKKRGTVTDTATIEKQIRKLRHQLANLSDQLDPEMGEEDPILLKQQQVMHQQRRLEKQLAEARRQHPTLPEDPAFAAERLVNELEKAVVNLPMEYAPEDAPRLRALLEVFVSKLEADLENRSLHLEIAVPMRLVESAATGRAVLPQVCLVNDTASHSVHETHPKKARKTKKGAPAPPRSAKLALPDDWFDGALPLAEVTCTYAQRRRPSDGPCYTCRRGRRMD